MDITKLKRDPTKIHADLKKLNDGTIITQAGCKIYIPQNYEDKKLVVVGVETYILGIFAIVLGDQFYGVSIAPAMMRVEPDEVNTIKVDDEEYMELGFDKGSVVIADKNLVQDNKLLFSVYNEFVAKGSVPWYFNYEDLGNLFRLSQYYTGSKLGANHAIMELIAATICRNPNNPKQQFRHIIDTKADLLKYDPRVIKLNSVTFGATNTTSKLIGAYWEEGLNSALIQPSQQREPIEDLLRR